MEPTNPLRQSLWFALTAGSTLSIGFLSFVGMYAIVPSIVLCGAAFVFAGAWEARVNGEGTNRAFNRMFDPDHLKLGIVERYLDELVENEKKLTKEKRGAEFPYANNTFYKDYKAQKQHVKKLKKYLYSYFIPAGDSLFPDYGYVTETEDRHEFLELVRQKEKELEEEEECLRCMKRFFLRNLYHPAPLANHLEREAINLLGDQAESLKKEIALKATLIKISWILSLTLGVCSGLATLSAIQASILSFAILSVIPGGAIVALAALAALGTAMLIYQGVSEFIEEYTNDWIDYFKKREKESHCMHIFRCALSVFAILIGIAACIATAGTWYGLVKDGTKLLGAVDKVAGTVRDVLLLVTLLPNMVFSTQNSVNSVDDICKSNYKKLFSDIWRNIKRTYQRENIVQFVNPFRFAEKIISYGGWGILFSGHVSSIGAGSDRLDFGFIGGPSFSPKETAAVGAFNEYFSDLGYLPDKDHVHESFVLRLLFLPLTITVFILKVAASLWDFAFSSSHNRNLKKSFEKMFTGVERNDPALVEPEKPQVSEDWRKQELIEMCDHTTSRLKNQSKLHQLLNDGPVTTQKTETVAKVKTAVVESGDAVLQKEALEGLVVPLSENRNGLWHKPIPQSKADMDLSIGRYFRHRAAVGA